MNKLLSINVGLPREVDWKGRKIRTAIWKKPVAGRRQARKLNIDGDGQADLAGHGGEQRAVLVYQEESYSYWAEHYGWPGFEYGLFGENLTVSGLADDEVCIGDRFQIGGAVFEVSQPRVTCYRLGIRLAKPELPGLLVAHGRPGFYMRVITEGEIGAGDEIVKIADGPERMSVAKTDGLLYSSSHPKHELESALRIPALSVGWQGSFEALLEQADAPQAPGNAGLGTQTARPAAWQGFREVNVAEIHQESGSVRSFILSSRDGHPLPEASPGQFVVVRRPASVGSGLVTRSYSLSGPPGAATYRISVKSHGEGSASSDLHRSLQVGDVVDISAPRGDFALMATDKPVVLISAGIGATPVLAMLYKLAESIRPVAAEVWWLHGAKNGAEHAFRTEAKQVLSVLERVRSHVAYSQPNSDDAIGLDYDAVGRLDDAALRQMGLPSDADFYICGPSGFMADTIGLLEQLGVSARRIHTEAFGTALKPPTRADLTEDDDDPDTTSDGPAVTFVRSGLVVQWKKRHESLLELAESRGIETRWSCRAGVCHMCETAVIDGQVSYDRDPLDPPGEGRVLICCARPASDLQLDI